MEIDCPKCGTTSSDQFPCPACKSILPIVSGYDLDASPFLQKNYLKYASLEAAIKAYQAKTHNGTKTILQVAASKGLLLGVTRGDVFPKEEGMILNR